MNFITDQWNLGYIDKEMYSIHNVGKLVVAEIVIKTLKTKIYKYRISISRNVYIDKFHDIIKIKLVDVKDNTYIDFDKKSNNKDPKFQVGHIVRISKYIFLKGMLQRIKDILQIDLKNFFWLKKLQILFHGHKLLVILMLKIFVKKEL